MMLLSADETIRSFEQAMLVCHCNGVSDRAIRKAVRKGAKSTNDVGMRTGAGSCCGGCLDTVNEIIRSEADKAPASGLIVLPVVPS
jgi:bacterioferritin-associated ferredoxin